jgi:CubicO group peptidase (beta-lactamase class C family)
MPNSVRLAFLLAALLSTNLFAVAQSNTASGINQDILSKIPERMHDFVAGNTVAGVVTLVALGNDIVEFDAQGSADIQSTQPMRKDTIFQIMSMTKPVTAIGIMMLAEEGKLSLRDQVDQFLPEFKNLQVFTNTGPDAARLSEPEHSITIRDLLTHTAGITDTAPAAISEYQHDMNVPLDEVVRRLAKERLLFQPGTAWS